MANLGENSPFSIVTPRQQYSWVTQAVDCGLYHAILEGGCRNKKLTTEIPPRGPVESHMEKKTSCAFSYKAKLMVCCGQQKSDLWWLC